MIGGTSNEPGDLMPLSRMDETFLRLDTMYTVGHVSVVFVFDGARLEPGVLNAAALRERIAAVLDDIPAFRWIPVAAPGQPGRHCWADAGLPDLEEHVTEIDLGGDAGLRDIAAVATWLSARPMPRTRPLWEMHVINGLASGETAVFFLVHHALGDGAATLAMGDVVFPASEQHTPPPPLSRVVAPQAGDADAPPAEPPDAPPTRFNREFCGRRDIVLADVSVPRMLAVKAAAGVTFPALITAISAGAMRMWLAERGELPEAPLVALIPTSDRRPWDGPLHGNSLGSIHLALPTDEPDPRRRLELVHERLQEAKRRLRSPRSGPRPQVRRRRRRNPVNLTVTTIPGNRMAWDDAPLVSNYGIGSVGNCGLVIACVTRGEASGLGIHVDSDQGDGGWSLADAMVEAFAELEAAS